MGTSREPAYFTYFKDTKMQQYVSWIVIICIVDSLKIKITV